MKIDIQKIESWEESVIIRYKELTPTIARVKEILEGQEGKLWGKTDSGSVGISFDEILYLESVDDKVFAYTKDQVVRIDGSLNSFMIERQDDPADKSMLLMLDYGVFYERSERAHV